MSRAGDVAAWTALVAGSLVAGGWIGYLASDAPTGAEPAGESTCTTDTDCMHGALLEVGTLEDALTWCQSLPISSVETDYAACLDLAYGIEWGTMTNA